MAAAADAQPKEEEKQGMNKIADGVEFNVVAREWRCKWSKDNDSASLAAAQAVLNEYKDDLKKIAGVKNVQRVVCGGCLDFKVITSVALANFGDWEKAEFAPEKAFLEKLGKIDGVSSVETQTFTLMDVWVWLTVYMVIYFVFIISCSNHYLRFGWFLAHERNWRTPYDVQEKFDSLRREFL